MHACRSTLEDPTCGFDRGAGPDGGSANGGGDGKSANDSGGGGNDVVGACTTWSYTPTNFDPCTLPAPQALIVTTSGTLDTGSTTLPKKTVIQLDGTAITVIHLSSLSVDTFATLTVTGSGVVFAVDGAVDVNGAIVAAGGDPAHCVTARGHAGTDSQNQNSGAGGGGGGAASDYGGSGGSGDGSQAGVAGARGDAVGASALSPLRAGCRGGDGGRANATGTVAEGGRGGGALQISTNAKITISGLLDAGGRGGAGAPTARAGGGGGGSGGSIFLEGPQVQLNFASRVCADGGSGGEGGGATVAGNNGVFSPCTGLAGAHTIGTLASAGGNGGDGGYLLARTGANGQSSGISGGAGGGGGGGVGWIRLASPGFTMNGSIITPAMN